MDVTGDTNGSNFGVETTALQPDGKVIVGGGRHRLARLLPATGKLSFSSANYIVAEAGGSVTVTVTRTDGTDGKVLAKVTLADVTTSSADYIFAPGTLDASFNPGMGPVETAVVQPDGNILIGGFFFNYSDGSRYGIARLNANGSLDTTFDPGSGTYTPNMNSVVSAIALQPDGKILIGGVFINFNGIFRRNLARLNSNGSLDPTFNPGGGADQWVRTIAVQPDGKIIIGGEFTDYSGTSRRFIARLESNGSLDPAFDPGFGANGPVSTAIVQPNGSILIGGEFQFYNGESRNFIARLNSNGSLDGSFNPGMGRNSVVDAMAVQADGKIVIIGGFTMFNGIPRNYIARLNPSGSLDPSFNPGTGPDDYPHAIVLEPDGKIIIVGSWAAYNGIVNNSVARLNADGSLDTTFDPGDGPNAGVRAVAVKPDGGIIIGGGFSRFNGVTRRGIAGVENGDFFVSWPGGDGTVRTLNLPIVNDSLSEPTESLTFKIIPLTGGATLGTYSNATLTIIDDDNHSNTAPVANSQSVTTDEDMTKPITLAGADPDGDSLIFTVIANPAHGTLSGAAPNLTYNPNAGYNGGDSFSFKVNDGHLDSTNTGSVSITVNTTLAKWKQKKFNAQELNNPAISGDAADPDGDGISNLFEYAFNLDPKQPSPANQIQTSLDANYISIIYPKAVAATDLTFRVEQSSDLITWSVVATVNVILADDGATQTVKAQVAINGAVEKFLRLVVAH